MAAITVPREECHRDRLSHRRPLYRAVIGQGDVGEGGLVMGHAPGQHLLRELQHQRQIVRIVHAVREFVRVFFEIEKERGQVREVDVFVFL